jgi:hypothetical protein
VAPSHAQSEAVVENFSALAERLGSKRPVYFRHVTPVNLLMEKLDYVVVRVLVPGLQPLHGHHQLPFLGGPHWASRGLQEYEQIPPHPFP